MKRIIYISLLCAFTVLTVFAARSFHAYQAPEAYAYGEAQTPEASEASTVMGMNRMEDDAVSVRGTPAQTEAAEAEEEEAEEEAAEAEEEETLLVAKSGALTDPEAEERMQLETAFPFYIRVNRAGNTVTVYGMDADGAYSVPYKAFVCSAGKETPLGVYQTSTKARWLSLVGGVWGQYTTRITGPFWFHSVPYFTQNEGDLEYEEYNKLGTLASLGCIRMTVEDVKWIYDNCPSGTTVELFDDEEEAGPLGKPVPPVIHNWSEKRGWDPTDPAEINPWRHQDPPAGRRAGGFSPEEM